MADELEKQETPAEEAPAKVDAVLVPQSYSPVTKIERDRIVALTKEFLPVLGVKNLYVKNYGSQLFIHPHPYDTLGYPRQSAQDGDPRYTWEERAAKDGVQYGTLVEADHRNPECVP